MFAALLVARLSGARLTVIRAWSMFSKKMFVQQYLLHRFYGRKKTQGFPGQPGQVLQDHGIVHRVLHRFSPGKRAVAGNQNRGTIQRVTTVEGPNNHPASIELIIVLNFTLREQAGAGHWAMEIVRMRSPQSRKGPAALRPSRGQETVRVDDTANRLEFPVKH